MMILADDWRNVFTGIGAWIALLGIWPGQTVSAEPIIALRAETAALETLDFGQGAVPLRSDTGGFSVYDFKAQKNCDLKNGSVEASDGIIKYTTETDDLTLWATFTPSSAGFVEVSGELLSKVESDRALILRYVLPLPAEGSKFQNSLSKTVYVNETTSALGAAIPIAAMTGNNWGVSLAIPPTFPCCFGMTGTREGLGIEIYLGLSPEVSGFPNRARFTFIIDKAHPEWGFRSALSQYYDHYPEYYEPRMDRAGFWNWNDPAGIESANKHEIIEKALPLYAAHGLTRSDSYDRQLKRDNTYGVNSFRYIIVGQREITDLPELPDGAENAQRVFDEFKSRWEAEGGSGRLHDKYSAIDRNKNIVEQIESSTVFNDDGNFRIRVRDTVWGGNSITYVQNPNPYLYEDEGRVTVGGFALDMVKQWFRKDPADGVHIDSIGSQWPSCMNFRREHFRYARYPLTFDKNGTVGLHNRISHYEFMESVRDAALEYDKFIFANGGDIYSLPNMDEHYNSLENSRFFLTSLIDIGGREITHELLSRERLEAFRICLGRKIMTAILYIWTDPDVVEDQMNRALPFTVFTAPNRFFRDQISYLLADNGFARDQELLKWFSEKVRMLHEAGWQPVTHGRTDAPSVVCERYGTGDVFYFPLVNLGRETVEVNLSIDLGALHISPVQGEAFYFTEVARGAKLEPSVVDKTAIIPLRLNPNEAHIVKLSRSW